MELEKKKKNLVYLDVSPYDSNGKCVKSGNYNSVYEAITQCAKKGYEQFIMISDGSQDDSGGVGNSQGFKDALRTAGLPFKTYYMNQDATIEEIYEMCIRDRRWGAERTDGGASVGIICRSPISIIDKNS